MAARRCFWSPSPGFYCFWVGGTRLNLVHALSRAHGCCPCCSASGFQSKAQSIWKGSAILWLEKLLCFWWWNSLFSIWTFSYSVSFIHKVPFCQKEMDTAGEMGRGRERERERHTERERERKTVGKKTRKEAGIDDIDHALSWNEWMLVYFFIWWTDWLIHMSWRRRRPWTSEALRGEEHVRVLMSLLQNCTLQHSYTQKTKRRIHWE